MIRLVASVELQKAVYSTLKTGSYPVYEIVPPNTDMPYITLGDENLTFSNTKTNKRTVHNITINTWSQGSSSNESKIMNDYVLQTLINGFTVNGYDMDMITLELLRTIKEQGTESLSQYIFHGVLQFEIILTNMEVK